MPGIEHPQMDAIRRLFAGRPAPEGLAALANTAAKLTPNQYALACAIKLGLAPAKGGPEADAALADVRTLLEGMRRWGWRAVGPNRQNEQGAPDPHSALWSTALAFILHELRLFRGAEDLLGMALAYFADHLAVCDAFWTPGGVRLPCARAKASVGQTLAPTWSVDSWIYAMLMGLPTKELGQPADHLPLDILLDCRELWPLIHGGLGPLDPKPTKLGIPIKLFRLHAEGGFVGAMVAEPEMNDPLAWIVVNAQGGIVATGRSLSDPAAAKLTGDFVRIFGQGPGRGPIPVKESPMSSVPAAPPQATITTNAPYRNIAVWLRVGHGATQAVWPNRDHQAQLSTWTPGGDHDDFGVKIGGADSPVAGTWVGERYSQDLLVEAIKRGLLPLAKDYQPTARDADLLKLVAIPGTSATGYSGPLAAWDALVAPALVAGGISVDAGHLPPNSTPGAPGVAPLPPPPAAPPPAPLAPPVAPAPAPAPAAAPTLQGIIAALAPLFGDRAESIGRIVVLFVRPKPKLGQVFAALAPLIDE